MEKFNYVDYIYIRREERINKFEKNWEMIEDCGEYIVYYKKEEINQNKIETYSIHIKDMDHQLEYIEYKGIRYTVFKGVQNFSYDGTIRKRLHLSL